MSESGRQRTVTEMQMDFAVQLDELRRHGKNRQELGLLQSPSTHGLIHEFQLMQDILRTGEKREEIVEFFDPDTLQTVKYKVEIDENGRIETTRDIEIYGIKKGTKIDVLLESPLFKTEISSLSYLESNRVLSKLASIEQITNLTLRMGAEEKAYEDQIASFKHPSRKPIKEKKKSTKKKVSSKKVQKQPSKKKQTSKNTQSKRKTSKKS